MDRETQAADFWAITTFFNPARYQRRLPNYRIFRKHLQVPLVAVELSYDNTFELQEGDADILVRLKGGGVLWQKERLLNVALQALPKSCRKVAWLDCDIIFQVDGWANLAGPLLDRAPIVQLFERVHYLPQQWTPDCPTSDMERSRLSAAAMVTSGASAAASIAIGSLALDKSGARGFAWAARRDLLDRHGFYDACIVGSGDSAFAGGAYGCLDAIIQGHYMNESQRRRFLAWAEPLYDVVKANIACLEGDILHLWHGSRANRAYIERRAGLQPFAFDPFNDIAIQDNGAWGWCSDKPDLHAYVRNYFFSRREDG